MKSHPPIVFLPYTLLLRVTEGNWSKVHVDGYMQLYVYMHPMQHLHVLLLKHSSPALSNKVPFLLSALRVDASQTLIEFLVKTVLSKKVLSFQSYDLVVYDLCCVYCFTTLNQTNVVGLLMYTYMFFFAECIHTTCSIVSLC